MASKHGRENAAANAVVLQLAVLTGSAVRGWLYDDNSRDCMHDFTITTDADTIALEVTTIADGARVGRDHRWERAAPEGWVEVSGLSGCWLAYHEGAVEGDTAVAALQAQVPVLEELGVEDLRTGRWQEHAFAPAAHRPPEWEASRALCGAGFTSLSRVTDAGPELLTDHSGQVFVSRSFGVERPADRNLPAALVTDQLHGDHLSDVQKLLAAVDVTARHLWLWIELTEGFAMLRSFEAEGLPDAGVEVDGLDAVWLGRSPTPEMVSGYVWRRGHGWSSFSVARDESDLDHR